MIIDGTDAGTCILSYEMPNGERMTLTYVRNVGIRFVKDSDYRNYLKQMNLDENIYMNTDDPVGVMYNDITIYSKKYYRLELFNTDKLNLKAGNGLNTVTLNIGTSADETPMGIATGGRAFR